MDISKVALRRFILGRQGLWPGRRWRGLEGTAQALREIEALQLDPLNVAARSQDIALWGRVANYRPEYLAHWMYQERQFFDYGGSLFVYPMTELPYWRLHMSRRADQGRWADFAAARPELMEMVRGELKARGPLGNRDFAGASTLEGNYRGRKDTALVLYALWISGEVMIHHRQGFDRRYDFRQNIVPPELDYPATEEQAEGYFSRKAIAFLGAVRERGWANSLADYLQRRLAPGEASRRLEALVEQGSAARVRVEGEKEDRYVLSSDLEILGTLQAGGCPAAWQPVETTTLEEAVILAPLDIVSARGRAKGLFDFDYVWEVYKPVEQRRWGYYTIPILYGDRLVGRLDPRLERKSATLILNGFWLEEHAALDDPAFAAALAKGLVRFAGFLEAKRLDIAAIQPAELRQAVGEQVSDLEVIL